MKKLMHVRELQGCTMMRRQHWSAGFTIIELLVVLAVITILTSLIVPAIQYAREAARRTQCRNNLRQLSLAMHMHVEQKGEFPPGWTGMPASNESLPHDYTETDQWVGHLGFVLPMLEQTPLYERLAQRPDLFDPTARRGPAWFTDDNVVDVIADASLPVLRCPSDPNESASNVIWAMDFLWVFISKNGSGKNVNGLTNYLGCGGHSTPYQNAHLNRSGIFYSRSSTRPADILDGLSNTILMAEVVGNSDYDKPKVTTAKHAFLCGSVTVDGFWFQQRNTDIGPANAMMYRSFHADAVNASMADGSVTTLSRHIDRRVLQSLSTRNGGEIVP